MKVAHGLGDVASMFDDLIEKYKKEEIEKDKENAIKEAELQARREKLRRKA